MTTKLKLQKSFSGRVIPSAYDPLITLTPSEEAVLRLAPLGELPWVRYKRGGYAMLPAPGIDDSTSAGLFNLWASWYFLNWRLVSDPALAEVRPCPDGGPDIAMPLSPWRRSAMEAKRDTYTRALGTFLADYVLISCFGEARHFVDCCGARKVCKECIAVHKLSGNSAFFYHNGHKLQRDGGSTAFWPVFANRLAAWDFVFHTNAAHLWASSIGGPNWAWLAGLGRVMDASLRQGNLALTSATIDALAFSHHAGSNFVSPRFSWSYPAFTWGGASWFETNMSFQTFLGWKQVAEECCWAGMRDALRPSLAPEAYEGMPKMKYNNKTNKINPEGCPHIPVPVQKLDDQDMFAKAVAIYQPACKKCGAKLDAKMRCVRACVYGCPDTCHPLGALTCPLICQRSVNSASGAAHMLVNCPGLCKACEDCHPVGHHSRCNPCRIAGVAEARANNHNNHPHLCRRCWTYSKCPTVGGKCVRCTPEWALAVLHAGRIMLPSTRDALIASTAASKEAKKAAGKWRRQHPGAPKRSYKDFLSSIADVQMAPLPLDVIVPELSTTPKETPNDTDPGKQPTPPPGSYITAKWSIPYVPTIWDDMVGAMPIPPGLPDPL